MEPAAHKHSITGCSQIFKHTENAEKTQTQCREYIPTQLPVPCYVIVNMLDINRKTENSKYNRHYAVTKINIE